MSEAFKAEISLLFKRENHFVHNDMHTNVLSRIDAITSWKVVTTAMSDAGICDGGNLSVMSSWNLLKFQQILTIYEI